MGIDNESIEDPVFDKVKIDGEFNLLIETSKKNALTLNDLNISIDDDALLSDKAYKKQKIMYYIIIILCVLLIGLTICFGLLSGIYFNTVFKHTLNLGLLIIILFLSILYKILHNVKNT